MRHDKPDANKPAIVADLRARGYVWIDIGGAVDGLCIGYSHNTESVAACLVEIKQPGSVRRFTESERALQEQLLAMDYHGVYLVATSVDDVLRWFGQL